MRFSAPGVAAPVVPRQRFAAPGAHTPTTSLPPTPEQERIIDAFKLGGPVVVEALAGTGKTTTLRMLAAVDTRKPGLYLAYNKAIVKEAEGRFPMAVQVGTAHSFAYRAMGHLYAHRLPRGKGGSKRLPARTVASILKVRAGDAGGAMINPVMITRLAEASIVKFCQSGDPVIGSQHLPDRAEHLGPLDAIAALVVPVANKIWRDLCSPTGRLFFSHDHYLKMWQLSDPTLPGDYLLFDEAQDANPAIAAVVNAQRNCQVVYVGDRNQQLYAWRGAIDAMSKVDGQRLALTKSFRFGPAIADEANRWLELLGSPHRLQGHEPVGSTLGPVESPDAVLCRTNGAALAYVMQFQAAGVPVSMAPGDASAGKDIMSFAFAALDLMAGRGTDNAELAAFTTWTELLLYVAEEEGGSDLGRMVNIVNRVGPSAAIDAIKRLVPKDRARVTVSTAHKAKGLEWDQVKVADDFTPPEDDKPVDPADLMVAYVTVTRTRKRLDPGSLNPADWSM